MRYGFRIASFGLVAIFVGFLIGRQPPAEADDTATQPSSVEIQIKQIELDRDNKLRDVQQQLDDARAQLSVSQTSDLQTRIDSLATEKLQIKQDAAKQIAAIQQVAGPATTTHPSQQLSAKRDRMLRELDERETLARSKLAKLAQANASSSEMHEYDRWRSGDPAMTQADGLAAREGEDSSRKEDARSQVQQLLRDLEAAKTQVMKMNEAEVQAGPAPFGGITDEQIAAWREERRAFYEGEIKTMFMGYNPTSQQRAAMTKGLRVAEDQEVKASDVEVAEFVISDSYRANAQQQGLPTFIGANQAHDNFDASWKQWLSGGDAGSKGQGELTYDLDKPGPVTKFPNWHGPWKTCPLCGGTGHSYASQQKTEQDASPDIAQVAGTGMSATIKNAISYCEMCGGTGQVPDYGK